MEKLFVEIHMIKSEQIFSGPGANPIPDDQNKWDEISLIPAEHVRWESSVERVGRVVQINPVGFYLNFSIYRRIPVHSIFENAQDPSKRRKSIVEAIRNALMYVPEAVLVGHEFIPRLVVVNLSRIPVHCNAAFEEPVWPDPSDSYLEPAISRFDRFFGRQEKSELERRGVEERAFSFLGAGIRYRPRNFGVELERLEDLDDWILSALKRKGLLP